MYQDCVFLRWGYFCRASDSPFVYGDISFVGLGRSLSSQRPCRRNKGPYRAGELGSSCLGGCLFGWLLGWLVGCLLGCLVGCWLLSLGKVLLGKVDPWDLRYDDLFESHQRIFGFTKMKGGPTGNLYIKGSLKPGKSGLIKGVIKHRCSLIIPQ